MVLFTSAGALQSLEGS